MESCGTYQVLLLLSLTSSASMAELKWSLLCVVLPACVVLEACVVLVCAGGGVVVVVVVVLDVPLRAAGCICACCCCCCPGGCDCCRSRRSDAEVGAEKERSTSRAAMPTERRDEPLVRMLVKSWKDCTRRKQRGLGRGHEG